MPISFKLNGNAITTDAAPDTPLLWFVRDELGLVGTKFGCGAGLCGACTVHLDGQPIRSCSTTISAIADRDITTIEMMESDQIGRAVQAAWVELAVAQCGYCQPGQIMTATALLRAQPHPTDAEIDQAMSGNICRCGTYTRIRAAIRLAEQTHAAGVVK